MLRSSLAKIPHNLPRLHRHMVVTAQSRRKGNISDAFVSLSGSKHPPLPDRFRQLKLDLVRGREKEVVDGWARLLRVLRRENEIIEPKGSQVIPQVKLAGLENGLDDALKAEIQKRGVVVVKGVIPEQEARAYKTEVEEYIRKNPSTRAFPSHDPQVYELYWSGPQLKARSHPSVLTAQKLLMSSFWHTSSPTAQICLDVQLSYADRLRIRKPGDATFALGPHMDGGSVERWEKNGYGRGGVYDRIFAGDWESYDAWDAAGRVDAVNNLYDGLGACSMFRMWQGWLSLSRTGPDEGTLLVYPLVQLSTVYVLLRPFFRPVSNEKGPGFLDETNWVFTGGAEMTSELQGATPGHGQELNELHPHLELARTMVPLTVGPGSFVAWHCDAIHAVDKVHRGRSDSSVLYIPVCPVTDINAEYLAQQRQAFREGVPGPDFPGGEGESGHVDRPTEKMLRVWAGGEGRRAMGLERLVVSSPLAVLSGAREVVERANARLGFC